MSSKKSSPGELHKNHRARMREKFIKYGFESFAEHERLEYVLFYCIPRVNTNTIAHKLLDKFGSIAGVLDASESELLEVEGVGLSTVHFLKLLPPVSRWYVNSSKVKEKRFDKLKDMCERLVDYYIGVTEERIRLICLDDINNILFDDFIQSGYVNNVGIDLRRINEVIVSTKATKFILAHNHPNGICEPSADDIRATAKIESTFSEFSATLIAHIIVAEGKCRVIDSKVLK